jgi:hypothetical protein
MAVWPVAAARSRFQVSPSRYPLMASTRTMSTIDTERAGV